MYHDHAIADSYGNYRRQFDVQKGMLTNSQINIYFYFAHQTHARSRILIILLRTVIIDGS